MQSTNELLYSQDHNQRVDPNLPDDQIPLSHAEVCDIVQEIEQQPNWRARADKEMDYIDGNQLNSDLLRKQAELGIPPAVENVMSPTIEGIKGYEAETRTDWRVTADGGVDGQDVADALNYRLNQAERQSHADKACSDAFVPQVSIGVGWVEVGRESDPTKFPYRCQAVHRGEIYWSMSERDDKRLVNTPWLLRKRWMASKRLALVFPDHKEAIMRMGAASTYGDYGMGGGLIEGLGSTGLFGSTDDARGWTVNEQHWYDPLQQLICPWEIWYRRWVSVVFIRTPDGRVVELDQKNPAHMLAVASGTSRPQRATVSRIRRAYWLGPLRLHDGFTPYAHQYFPYVPFWHRREDATGVPFGEARAMMFPQETLNSGISKLRWGMSAVRTERTKGAVAMTDKAFRAMVARVDADIVLDAEHMKETGARFEVKRDYTLTEQHYKLIEDARATIARVGPGSPALQGKQGTATSGIQEQTQLEQSNQQLASLMDEFREARTVVGEILMSMLIEDIGKETQTVVIEGDAIREPRTVVLNGPERDPVTGMTYLSNDVMRTRLKVALEEVPTSASFRAQQLYTITEALKSSPPEIQKALTPFMVALMDLPYKKEVVDAVRNAGTGTEEADIQARIKQAVKDAGLELKQLELDRKYPKELIDAQVRRTLAEVFKTNGAALYEAIQTAGTLAMNPAAAPLADHTAKIAGFQEAPGGQDPNFPVAGLPDPATMPPPPPPGGVVANTDPTQPPIPQQPPGPSTGIETAQLGDGAPSGFVPGGPQ